jgi:hypothetical protein
VSGPGGPVGSPPRQVSEWVQQSTFSSGVTCVLCGADDYGKVGLTHRDGCPAERFPTRMELFSAVAFGPSLNISAAIEEMRRQAREHGAPHPDHHPALWQQLAEGVLEAAQGVPLLDVEAAIGQLRLALRDVLGPDVSDERLEPWARAIVTAGVRWGDGLVDAEVVDESVVSLAREDVDELVGRAFAGMAVAGLDAEDCALLARVKG